MGDPPSESQPPFSCVVHTRISGHPQECARADLGSVGLGGAGASAGPAALSDVDVEWRLPVGVGGPHFERLAGEAPAMPWSFW